MTTMERMLSATKDIWAQYHTHPFVTGLRDGTLDEEKFRFYIVQDYLYLRDYARVFGVGTAKARDLDLMRIFANYIGVLLNGEMNLHLGYTGAMSITREELDATPVHPVNRSYTSYMLRCAYEGGEPEVLAAVLSCAYSYEVIAHTMAAARPESMDHPLYGEWVRGYCHEGYHAENQVMIDAFEKCTEGLSEDRLRHLEEIFVACSLYELDFWNMAWNCKD